METLLNLQNTEITKIGIYEKKLTNIVFRKEYSSKTYKTWIDKFLSITTYIKHPSGWYNCGHLLYETEDNTQNGLNKIPYSELKYVLIEGEVYDKWNIIIYAKNGNSPESSYKEFFNSKSSQNDRIMELETEIKCNFLKVYGDNHIYPQWY